ncbi:helix-turn-helix transcriptional regulator [Bifidobacterium animalis]|uniref:helix-turn-helix transcriptional regulator n=1 Tax=Bifidobacterium animalis TaxID=28025 RepID=UPI001BD09A11|nr:helix-turn-helix domain-containing protein [Bifidobacterium animalis]
MNTPQPATRLLNIDQLAEILGISKYTIYRKRSKGLKNEIPPAINIGKKLFWRQSDVDDWIDNRPTV